MRRALLIDFGSTFTKVRAVDLERRRLLAATQAPSTVSTNVMHGLTHALDALWRELPTERPDEYIRLASSSAAGGLRIAALGLVADLTMEAARRAALGAGGKVVATYAGGLSSAELRELEGIDPDIIVLSGGTDGGDTRCILHNARALSDSPLSCPVIVAGNRKVADDVAQALRDGGKRTTVVDNVMPAVDRLDIAACSEAIREAFMEHIVTSKGLRDAEAYVGRIVMPTPQAVMRACEVLANGPGGDDGRRELVCVDVGGATTDVYSFAEGAPSTGRVTVRGLPEPLAKRTVEADLGVRVNAVSIVEAVGPGVVAPASRENALAAAAELTQHTDALPATRVEREFDRALARAAAAVAVHRHAGTVEVGYGPEGRFFVQRGKDLRTVDTIIATGGIFQVADDAAAREILSGSTANPEHPEHLTPRAPDGYLDRDYVLYAAGLLTYVDREAAYALAAESLHPIGQVASPPAAAVQER